MGSGSPDTNSVPDFGEKARGEARTRRGATMSTLRERVAEAVDRYIGERLKGLGKPATALAASEDLFREGVLDSVALTGLIAAVEAAIEREIDFIDVDPDALGTRDSIVAELARAAGP